MAARLALSLVAVSVVGALLAKGGKGDVLPLVPAYALGLAGPFSPWQPFTYVFLADSPLGVIFNALIVYSMGGALESRWGGRRLLVFSIGVTVLAGMLTVLLAVPVPSLRPLAVGGSMAMAGALWVAYGLSFGNAQTNFWGLPVSGNGLALIGVGFVALSALFGAWQPVVPEALALGLTYLYMKGGRPRVLWLRFQNWRLQRSLRGRAKHLKVVTGERKTPSGSDRYLH
jgi:membrane associated rhomboid family serine protease